jgi:hypothetical protein
MMNMCTITGPETAIEALLTFEGIQGEEVSQVEASEYMRDLMLVQLCRP